MTAPSSPSPTSSSGGPSPSRGRLLRRYGPVIAIIVVIAIVAVIATSGGGGGGGKEAGPTSESALPLTFDQAKAQGKSVDWGPNCDTTTGRVAVPLWYAPPCVPPWKGGDNGGATTPGVTADTITVAVYQAQPDLLEQVFFEQSGSDESLNTELQTNQQYADFFSSHYELYGRKIKLVPVKASGAPDDDVAAKADAIKVATEVHAFASWGGPSQTSVYADELASRGVLCVGDCILAEPESFIESRGPNIWPTLASPDQASEHWAEFVGKQLAGHKASHAGDPALVKQQRRFGIVRYDDDAGTFRQSFQHFSSALKKQGVKIAADVPYQLDLEKAQETARTVIAALKEAKVSSVILAGDPIFPLYLTQEATNQNYFPEWVVMGYAFTDTSLFGRTYDQRQWSHAFGVTLLPTRAADAVDQLASIIKWQTGQDPAAKTFRVLVQAPLIFFTGIHMAGPHLTPETFRDGLFRFPADRPTSPPFVHVSWGRHGIWPGTDYNGGDDAGVIFWDPQASGPDEVGNVGKGMWRYALGGKRYMPGHWPKSSVGLFDVKDSVTLLESLPPGAAPPDYPSPAP
jgi:hypothetical protein